MQRCLVIKTSSLGDILQTLPVVLSLKNRYPSMVMDWVVEKKWAPTLEAFKGIDKLLVCDFKTWKKKPLKHFAAIRKFIQVLKQQKYDLVLDFQGNLKSGVIMGLAKGKEKRSFAFSQLPEKTHYLFKAKRLVVKQTHYLDYYHGLVSDLIPKLEPVKPELKKSKLAEELEIDLSKKVIMLGLGSFWRSKEMSTEQIKELLKKLSNENAFFIIPALSSEKKKFEELLGSYSGIVISFPELMDYVPYFEKTTLFIGVDSSLLHLARLLKIPSQGIFGPSSSLFYGSDEDLQGSCPFNRSFIKRCPQLRTCSAPCMKNLNFKKAHNQYKI